MSIEVGSHPAADASGFSDFHSQIPVPVLVPVPSSIWSLSVHPCETTDGALNHWGDREIVSNDAGFLLIRTNGVRWSPVGTRTENPGVGGSIPSLPTIFFR